MRLQPGRDPGLTFAIHHQASVIFVQAPARAGCCAISPYGIFQPDQSGLTGFSSTPDRCHVRLRSQGLAFLHAQNDIHTIAKLKSAVDKQSLPRRQVHGRNGRKIAGRPFKRYKPDRAIAVNAIYQKTRSRRISKEWACQSRLSPFDQNPALLTGRGFCEGYPCLILQLLVEA